VNSVATIRWSCTPAARGEASQTIGGHHPGQRFHGRPGRAVGDEPPPRHRRLAHRDVDDPPGTGGDHPRRHRPRHEERPGHLRVDDVAKSRRGDLPERLRIGEEARVDGAHPDPGVVDEHVESAEALPDLVGVDHRFVADVEFHPQGVGPESLRDALPPDNPRPVTTTRAPAALSASAIAAPSPLVAPVTITRVPASSLTVRSRLRPRRASAREW